LKLKVTFPFIKVLRKAFVTQADACLSEQKLNLVVTACWFPDPHRRPSFEDILQALDAIVHSAFTQTPHESFHTMQEDWKLEIEEVLHGLRMKEKVSSLCLLQYKVDCCSGDIHL
jgi:hypothetical protein